MNHLPTFHPLICACAFVLAGCVAAPVPYGAAHLTEKECRDLTALKNNAPITHERNMSELAALEKAGYNPSPFYDPYYPDDLHAAQRLVDMWYRTDCIGTGTPTSG